MLVIRPIIAALVIIIKSLIVVISSRTTLLYLLFLSLLLVLPAVTLVISPLVTFVPLLLPYFSSIISCAGTERRGLVRQEGGNDPVPVGTIIIARKTPMKRDDAAPHPRILAIIVYEL